MKRPAKKFTAAKITLGVNPFNEIDWTPPDLKVTPRQLRVTRGDITIEIEECDWGSDLGLFVGAGNGKTSTLFNLFGETFMPVELDLFIEVLTLARDKAREIGMPSKER